MNTSVIEMYAREKDLDSFRASLMKLEGDFTFDSSIMVELGRIYFEKFPDRFSDRNMEEVQHGYTLVRICSIEKIVSLVDKEKRDSYRKIFHDVSVVNDTMKELLDTFGKESLQNDYTEMHHELQNIKFVIDEIPKSMIKERFVGGISNLFNVFYLLKMNIDKAV
jgi:hypothetical protein